MCISCKTLVSRSIGSLNSQKIIMILVVISFSYAFCKTNINRHSDNLNISSSLFCLRLPIVLPIEFKGN